MNETRWTVLLIMWGLIALAWIVFGIVWWLRLRRRKTPIYLDFRAKASDGTHTAGGVMDMTSIGHLNTDNQIHRLNLLRKMGYVMMVRPPEGIELGPDGIYRRKLPNKSELQEEKNADPSEGSRKADDHR